MRTRAWRAAGAASRATAFEFAFMFALALSACGYRAVYGSGGDPATAERFQVILVRSLIPDAVTADEVVVGVRERLAREGALASGGGAADGYPRIEVEVLRVDEASEAVRAGMSGPEARAIARGLTARGWIRRGPGAPIERDTGDLRAFDAFSVGAGDPADALFAAGAAARVTGRRLGGRIALRILGFPVPPDESGGLDR